MQWKVHKWRKFQEHLINHNFHKASASVQKFLKGFVVSKKYEQVYIRIRLTDNIKFFDNFKEHLKCSA